MTTPEPFAHRATCVALSGRGVLIEGLPGSGKSSLALALMDRGAALVGDDGVLLAAEGGRLHARPHPNTRGLMEVRGLGVLPFPAVDHAAIALLIRLEADAPRFIDAAETVMLGGVAVPMVRLWPHAPVLHLRAELALEHYGLR